MTTIPSYHALKNGTNGAYNTTDMLAHLLEVRLRSVNNISAERAHFNRVFGPLERLAVDLQLGSKAFWLGNFVLCQRRKEVFSVRKRVVHFKQDGAVPSVHVV